MGMLTTIEQINANMQVASTLVTASGVVNIDTIDNAALRAAGMERRVRRIVIQNLDNTVRQVTLGTCTAPNVNRANLIVKQVTNFQTIILEPEKPGDDYLKFLFSATATRLGAALDAAAATGVRVDVHYYDDLTV